MRKLTTEEFISKARLVHGDKYDYSKTEYKTAHSKVCIICPIHGEFWQEANTHMRGGGCTLCGITKVANGNTLKKEQFVKKANLVHNYNYDYSKTEYIKSTLPVCIICPTHGEFYKTPHMHLQGQGCPHCLRKFGIFDMTNCKQIYSYNIWDSIIGRCYRNKRKHDDCYKDCSICDEWLSFSVFKEWFDNPENGYKDGYQLDKDILVKGNRVYSPQTCCFVPQEINKLILKNKKRRGDYPIGVTKTKGGKFFTSLGRIKKYIGTFDTPKEAFNAYKDAKERYIKEIAEKYFQEGKITEKVYDALMKYEVEITD